MTNEGDIIMTLNLSVCIETLYTELPFLERIKAVKSDGFSHIEFWSWENKDLEAIKNVCRDIDMKIKTFNGDSSYSLIDPTHKKDYLTYLEKSILVAKEINAKSLTIHSNALDDTGSVIKQYTELSETVKTCSMYNALLNCLDLAEQYNISLNLEPSNIYVDHIGNYLTTTQMAAEMVQLIDSPKLKVLYDVYHMHINEGNITYNIKKYWNEIGHIHIADAPGRNEPGTGEINYKYIFHLLKSLNYNGVVGCELFPKHNTTTAIKSFMNI